MPNMVLKCLNYNELMVGVLKRLNYIGGAPNTITNEEVLLVLGIGL